MRFKEIVGGIADLIWPPRCIACGARISPASTDEPTSFFCGICGESLMPITSPRCPKCALPFQGIGPDHLCGECLAVPPAFSAAVSLFQYGEAAADAVTRLKYGAMPHLAQLMGRSLLPAVSSLGSVDLIVPVPLHRARLIRRGFNQSALLARPIADALRCPLRGNAVVRIRETISQAGLSRDERKKNLSGAFAVPRPTAVEGSTVLLVDDVITTGSTVREISKVLVRAGAEAVWIAAFARAV